MNLKKAGNMEVKGQPYLGVYTQYFSIILQNPASAFAEPWFFYSLKEVLYDTFFILFSFLSIRKFSVTHPLRVRSRQSVYEGACDGEGRDRMTIAHEIGHYFTICVCGFKSTRIFNEKRIPAFQDPEWQAKCFAGELMVATHLVKGMNEYEIAKRCGVSCDAAHMQYKHL